MRPASAVAAWVVAVSLACSPALAVATDWSKAAKVTVTMIDDAFQPDHLTFQAGQPAELTP
jgi:hypothetical protein